jgi:hypothetical protein
MPKPIEWSCPSHEVDEDDARWTEALGIMSDQLKAKGQGKTFTPCPWCLEELWNEMQEAHNALDTVGVPRHARGKALLPLNERLSMLLDSEEPISELRTS